VGRLRLRAPLLFLAAGVAVAAPAAARLEREPRPVVVAVAGDIACDPLDPRFQDGAGTAGNCRQTDTSKLLLDRRVFPRLDAVLTAGDNQYLIGSLDAFRGSYDPSWGRLKAITRPSPGNHEYLTESASGYFAYFGAAAGPPGRGYYSFDLGAWHVVSLNANCGFVGGCGAASPEVRWLRRDLARSSAKCTLAYWHQPRFSSGLHGSDTSYRELWQALYEAKADVVVNGHDHDYERFAPQDPDGRLDPVGGIREIVVGTGGESLRGFPKVVPNSRARDSMTFGVLRLTLRASSYDWSFLPAAGSFRDSGTAACH